MQISKGDDSSIPWAPRKHLRPSPAAPAWLGDDLARPNVTFDLARDAARYALHCQPNFPPFRKFQIPMLENIFMEYLMRNGKKNLENED